MHISKMELLFQIGGKKYQVQNIVKVDGLSSTEYQPNLVYNSQIDGGIVQNTTVLPRYLNIEFDAVNQEYDFLIKFFKPKIQGKLTVTRNENTRWIHFNIHSFRIEQFNLRNEPKVILSLLCPDPYFYDMDDFGENMAQSVPTFCFPFAVTTLVTASYRKFSDNLMILNSGDTAIGIKALFVADDAVKKPQIKLGTGEFVKILVDLNKNDELLVQTLNGKKAIYLNGAKCTNFDRRSSFFSLKEGENIISFSAESGASRLSVTLYYQPRYLGV